MDSHSWDWQFRHVQELEAMTENSIRNLFATGPSKVGVYRQLCQSTLLFLLRDSLIFNATDTQPKWRNSGHDAQFVVKRTACLIGLGRIESIANGTNPPLKYESKASSSGLNYLRALGVPFHQSSPSWSRSGRDAHCLRTSSVLFGPRRWTL